MIKKNYKVNLTGENAKKIYKELIKIEFSGDCLKMIVKSEHGSTLISATENGVKTLSGNLLEDTHLKKIEALIPQIIEKCRESISVA